MAAVGWPPVSPEERASPMSRSLPAPNAGGPASYVSLRTHALSEYTGTKLDILPERLFTKIANQNFSPYIGAERSLEK